MPLSAVLFSLVTITLWSFLGYLGASLADVPPLLITGLALSISGLVGMLRIRDWKVPLKTLLVGIGGIFGYHFFYFTGLQHAPVVEANLVNYLWPLLIVLLAPLFLHGYRLRTNHILGALLGLIGAALIATGGRVSLDIAHLPGYLSVALAAFLWASYSLLIKRLPHFLTGAVGGFCFFSGLLSLGIFSVQSKSFPSLSALNGADWFHVVLLGAGPLGTAFFTWDRAMKTGDPRIVGSLAYLTPMTSTLLLVFAGGQPFNWVSLTAMLLIIAGALVGSLDLFKKETRASMTG
jgi:drug/metabolite transporter (DMT)-like permease